VSGVEPGGSVTEPIRILLFANFERWRAQSYFYNTDHKLFHGLTRAGHLVLPFSERDTARDLSPFGSKRFGISKMADRAIETVTQFQPHLIIIGHADTVPDTFFARLREASPGVRLVRFCVDSLQHHSGPIKSFSRHLPLVDLGFLTTGDAEARRGLGGPVAFLPHSADAAIETKRVHDVPASKLDSDVIFLGTGRAGRDDQLAYLESNLPDELRFDIGGRSRDGVQTRGMAFLDRLTSGAASPCLPLDDRIQMPELYVSNRLTQVMGNGLLSYTHRAANYASLFDEGVVEFDGREELAELMARFWRDDAERRRLAEIGWRITHEDFNCETVARYVVETAMQRPLSREYRWPTGISE